MLPDPIVDDEEYESSQDSDFAPEDAIAADGASEASDSETDGEDAAAAATKLAKRKRDADGGEAEDAGFENSGDEALIKKANKKRRRKTKDADAAAAAAAAPDEEDEGGDGGLVKTRSMRAAEKQERKTAAVSGPVTVDVEAIWAQMLAGQTVTPPTTEDKTAEEADPDGAKEPGAEADATKPDEALGGDDPSDMIRIKRTYNFAGKVHTEEKLVARSSAEARLYLASLGKDAAEGGGEGQEEEEEEPKRVLKKAFRSAFEPVIEVAGQRSDLNLGVAVRIKAREKEAQAKKLNTVEKSKMDWAGFVDKEGLKDELELAGRAKGSYAERQDFLARSEAKREEEARRARLAGRVL
ncbi:bucentaur or craniofacial development-domain-containing protein [Colletotrichum navitas]|uniref:SWR1-complex protein 5 n=1 Tax=Colletotrichum navitas TaxID=681940 RepID=A0AAD8V3N7_9PEZI|nr:bucentaur or craniofacial development-domain-containing protein [Colletotrichum navitas]KAK1586012.1 bucentaur or craniofacial development-domain-containing protein [Colletotrichum navitas]